MMTSMSDSQPIRPPRITRSSSKDSSGGLLMSMIRTLTASRDLADRDREKANLEREYRECDAKLSQLVVSHRTELSQVMSAFSKISIRLKQSRERIVATREKLQTCMKLLHCKRDELKKLWLESVENKVILELLDQVESLMIMPQDVANFINKKHYLHATQLLKTSLAQLDGNLSNVDALKEVRTELLAKKDSLYDIIIDELHKHVYLKSTADVMKRFKRQGSGRRKGDETPARKMSVADILSPAVFQSALSKKRSASLSQVIDATGDVEEDLNLSDPEEDSKHFIAILIECLALLNKIPETIETIKERCEKDLINIVKRTGRELASENAPSNALSLQQKSSMPIVLHSSLLLENGDRRQNQTALVFKDFLELLFQQFKTIVQMHDTVILVHLRRIESQNPGEGIQAYSLADIWAKIQTVLQIVADLYLDVGGSNEKTLIPNGAQESTNLITGNPAHSDLTSYFARRRGINVAIGGVKKKTSLFRFDSSSHAISLNAYLQEQKETIREKADVNGGAPMDSIDLSLNSADQFMVCQPAAENIVLMFNPMMKFIGEVEDELQFEEGNHCPLYDHVVDCAKTFLNQISAEIERVLDLSNKSMDIWKVTADPEVLSFLGLTRPLLHSTLMIDRAIYDLKNLMFALPLFADYFLTLICNSLSNYKETCFAAYRGIVQPEPEDKRIISATWAKDEDIRRFLKSLPNWASLQVQSEKHGKTPIRSISQDMRMTLDESPEEIRLRNMREAEILTSNLGQDTLIPTHEILSDVAQLRVLAQLQESMEWIGRRCDDLVNDLPQNSGDSSFLNPATTKTSVEIPPLSDVSIATLNQLSQDFEELAETCLLVLHLEVCVHCFYFLSPVATQSSFYLGIDNQEADSEVIRFTKDLVAIDEAMGIALQPWKLRYIFEGLGYLISNILINSTNTIQRINSNGVKKMCRNILIIQQSLTSVTKNREVSLDTTKQFFELFYHTPEEILAMIIERGPQFQLNEYTNAITLLHRSLPGRESSSLETILRKLEEILSEVAVSL